MNQITIITVSHKNKYFLKKQTYHKIKQLNRTLQKQKGVKQLALIKMQKPSSCH